MEFSVGLAIKLTVIVKFRVCISRKLDSTPSRFNVECICVVLVDGIVLYSKCLLILKT